MSKAREEERRVPKTAILLVVLPHLLFAFMNLIPDLLRALPPVWNAFAYLLSAALTAALLVAWRQGWPLWSAGWAGYAALFAGLILPSFLSGSSGAYWLNQLVSVAPLFLLIVFGMFLFQRRPLYALLASLPLLVLMNRFFTFELVTGGEWIFTGIWLLAALLSGAIVWLRTIGTGIWLTVGFHLVAGTVFTWGLATLPHRWGEIGPRAAPTWPALVNDFVPITLALITLTLALLLLHPVGRMARAGHKGTQRTHYWLLGGMAVALGGMFGLRMTGATPGLGATIAWLALGAGLVVSMTAAIKLGRTAQHQRQQRLRTYLGPLLLAFAPLVVFAPPTPFAPIGAYSESFQYIVGLTYTGLLLWTGCALWYLLGNQGRIDALPSARVTEATAAAPGPV